MLRMIVPSCLAFGLLFNGCKDRKAPFTPQATPTNPPASEMESIPRPEADLDLEAPFVLIPKEQSLSQEIASLSNAQALRLADPVKGTDNLTDFYLAINQRELNKPWYLTASTKQLYPSWYASPYFNLGTRVVTFTIQNGKLFVFDTDERRNGSRVSAPTVVVDAYPIVPLTPRLQKLGLDSNFVVFDPALGLSQHGPMEDLFARLSSGDIAMQTDIKYLRRYDKLNDGIYFEMVFSGVTNVDLTDGFAIEQQDPNPTRVVGTLGISLRRYQETPGFKTMDVSVLNAPFYFAGADQVFGPDATRNPQQSGVINPVLKWGNIRPGMKPIVFRITPQIRLTQRDFPEYNVLGAVTRGIESWNKVFGFEVFKVEIGTGQDSWAADDTNMIIWDNNANLGYAYADARINPKTGEIRAANIYMDSMWLYYADEVFSDLPAPAVRPGTRARPHASPRARLPRMTGFAWGSLKPINLCGLRLDPAAARTRLALQSAMRKAGTYQPPPLDRKQAVENFVANVIAHEAGHVLGLRHNFVGSTFKDNETSSIMDYYDDYLSAVRPDPAVYDIEAVKYLYGQRSSQPTQAFCTDEDLGKNPLCRQFDFGINPLEKMLLPQLQALKQEYLKTASADLEGALVYAQQQALDFLQGGTAAEQQVAWAGLIKDLKASPPTPGIPQVPPTVDVLSRILIDAAFFTASPDSAFAEGFITKPKLDDATATIIAADLAAMGANLDALRSMETRRLAIDALKKMQNNAALTELTKLRAELNSKKATMTGAAGLVENDLIIRIDKHLSPYYD